MSSRWGKVGGRYLLFALRVERDRLSATYLFAPKLPSRWTLRALFGESAEGYIGAEPLPFEGKGMATVVWDGSKARATKDTVPAGVKRKLEEYRAGRLTAETRGPLDAAAVEAAFKAAKPSKPEFRRILGFWAGLRDAYQVAVPLAKSLPLKRRLRVRRLLGDSVERQWYDAALLAAGLEAFAEVLPDHAWWNGAWRASEPCWPTIRLCRARGTLQQLEGLQVRGRLGGLAVKVEHNFFKPTSDSFEPAGGTTEILYTSSQPLDPKRLRRLARAVEKRFRKCAERCTEEERLREETLHALSEILGEMGVPEAALLAEVGAEGDTVFVNLLEEYAPLTPEVARRLERKLGRKVAASSPPPSSARAELERELRELLS